MSETLVAELLGYCKTRYGIQQFSVRGSWRPGKKVWGPTRPSGGEGT